PLARPADVGRGLLALGRRIGRPVTEVAAALEREPAQQGRDPLAEVPLGESIDDTARGPVAIEERAEHGLIGIARPSPPQRGLGHLEPGMATEVASDRSRRSATT